MPAFLFGFLAYLLVAQSPVYKEFQLKPDLFPAIIIGTDQIVYFIVASDKSEFVPGPNGEIFVRNPDFVGELGENNARYEGRRYFKSQAPDSEPTGGQVELNSLSNNSISSSFHQIIDQILKEREQHNHPQLFQTTDLFRVRISAGLFVNLFHQLQKNQDYYFSLLHNMTPRKADLLKRLIFSATFDINSVDLSDLNRSADQPSPAPVTFALRIPGNSIFVSGGKSNASSKTSSPKGSIWESFGNLLGTGVDWFYVMNKNIQIKDLRFDIHRRAFVFDPKLNLMGVKLDADQAVMKGPYLDTGIVKLKNMEVWGLPWAESSGKGELTSGKVKDIGLRFNVQMKHEDSGLWSLDQKLQSSFTIQFSDKVPKVVMRFTHDPNEVPRSLELDGSTITMIERRLRQMATSGLGGRYLEDSISYPIESTVNNDWNDSSELNHNFYLDSLDILPQGLSGNFRLQIVNKEVADCIKDIFEAQSNTTASSQPNSDEALRSLFQMDHPSSKYRWWGLYWDLDSNQWKLNLVPPIQDSNNNTVEGQPFSPDDESIEENGFNFFKDSLIEVEAKWDLFNALLRRAWGAGKFCVTTRQWKSRPDFVPFLALRPIQSPEVSVGPDNKLQLKLALEIRSVEGNDPNQSVKTPPKDALLLKNIELKLIFQLNAKDDLIMEAPQISGSELTDAERALVFDFFTPLVLDRLKIFPMDSDGRIQDKTYTWKSLVQMFSNFSLDILSVQWNSDKVLVSAELPFDVWNGVKTPLLPNEISTALVPHAGERTKTLPVPESPDRPLMTQFTEKPPYNVHSALVKFAWDQVYRNSPEDAKQIEYSYRLRRPSTDSKTGDQWSEPTAYRVELTSAEIALDKEGLYAFEVRARDRRFNLEKSRDLAPGKKTYARTEFYYRPEEKKLGTPLPSGSNQDWQSPVAQAPSDQTSKKDIKQVNKLPSRMASKGPFGCSLQQVSGGGASGFFVLIFLFLKGLLVIFRRKSNF